MLHKYIKYEKLSKEIKEEISAFHSARLSGDPDLREDDSIKMWFEERFDSWMSYKFDGASGSSSRRHFRIDVEIPIKVVEILIESSNDDGSAPDTAGKVRNISRGGLYFKHNRPLPVSSMVEIAVDFSKIDPELGAMEALAMVVRVDNFDDGDYGMGILFSSISDEERGNLDAFILKHVSNYLSADMG